MSNAQITADNVVNVILSKIVARNENISDANGQVLLHSVYRYLHASDFGLVNFNTADKEILTNLVNFKRFKAYINLV